MKGRMRWRLAVLGFPLFTIAVIAQQPVAVPLPPPPPPPPPFQGTFVAPDGSVATFNIQGGVVGGVSGSLADVAGRFNMALPGSPQPPQMRVGNSRISGRITGSNGLPLRQAMVRINGAGAAKSTTTDPDGRYDLRDLPAGRFTLSVTKDGYLGLSYGQAKPADAPKMIDLAENQSLDTISMILPRGGVITGRLLDDYGEPVTDAQVMTMQKRFMQGQIRPMASGRSATTNDIGEFRIFGLPPGQYLISARPRPVFYANPLDQAGATTGYAPVYYPGTTDADNAQLITVGLGETVSNIELSLVTVRLASISGIVVDAQGTPLPRGNISAMDRSGFGGGLAAQIKPDGSFTLAGLPPGEYILRANAAFGTAVQTVTTAAGATATVLRTTPLDSTGRPPTPVAPPDVLTASVTVNGGDVSGVVVAPMRKVAVSGRITFQGGAPSPSLRGSMMRIAVSPRSLEASLMQGPPATVRDDFTFELTVPAAEIALRPTTGSQDWVVKAIRVGAADITDVGVDLRGGRELSGVEIELTNRPPEVMGLVTNARGESLKDYTVLVFPQERERWILDSRLVTTARASGADGRYRIRTLPAGRYLAIAFESMPPITYQDPQFLENVRARATSFAIADGQSTLLDLKVDAR
jgi:hypothetical protein